MGKFNDKTAAEIIEFIEADAFTISEICNMFNISRKTFYNWQESNPEFKEEVEQAKERAEEKLLIQARRALKDKLEGNNQIHETIITYEPDENSNTGFRVKKKVVKVKVIPPSTKDIKWIIERAEKMERARKDKEEMEAWRKPKKTFEERLEEKKQQYGYYEILDRIHKRKAEACEDSEQLSGNSEQSAGILHNEKDVNCV